MLRKDVNRALIWVTDLRAQVEDMQKRNLWFRVTSYLEVPDTRPLRVIEQVLREKLKKQGAKHGSDLEIQD